MASDPASGPDDPIEAEFEPAGPPGGAGAASGAASAKTWARRGVSWAELAVACVLSIMIASAMSVVATRSGALGAQGAGAAADPEDGRKAAAQASRLAADLAQLRTTVDARFEKTDAAIAERGKAEAALQADIASLNTQLTALVGADPATAQPGALGKAPLAALLARVQTLENVIEQDSDSPQTSRQVARAMHDLSIRIADLETAKDAVVRADAQKTEAVAALQRALTQANNDIARLKADVGSGVSVGAQLGGLRKSVQELKATHAAERGPILAAVSESRTLQALSALQSVSSQGRPFLPQQQKLAELLPGDADVAALKAIARRGAPTLEQLQRDFATSAERAERAAAAADDDGWDWLRTAFSGLATVRRTNVDKQTSTMLRDAQKGLETGDLHYALEIVRQLPRAAADSFEHWRADAERRSDLNERLEALNARLISAASSGEQG